MACIFVGKYKPIHTHEHPHSLLRHQMETFSALLALCAGNSPVDSPHKGQWRGALMFSLNSWVNNRDAGDLRRHRAHYDVIVMWERHKLCSDVNGHKELLWPDCIFYPCLSKVLVNWRRRYIWNVFSNCLRPCSVTDRKHAPESSQVARFMGPAWGPPGYCWPQVGPMLSP